MQKSTEMLLGTEGINQQGPLSNLLAVCFLDERSGTDPIGPLRRTFHLGRDSCLTLW